MYLREVPIEQLRTGDRVLSYKGRPGVIVFSDPIGEYPADCFIIVWSRDKKWMERTPEPNPAYDQSSYLSRFISVGANVHFDTVEHPVGKNDIEYLGQQE